MPGLGALWDSLVDCICRPPRDEYLYPDDLIGGRRGLFRVGRFPGAREDLTLVNRRGLRLACSHFFPKHVRGRDGRLPCVLYCHCNSGSRRDAEEAICVLIPHGVSVFTLDFAGSGLSEGQWVTLGCEEVEDVGAAVEYLRSSGRVSTLGLWGRSMGAVTALLYSQRDPSIAGMVLDSPFSRLTDLMMEIVAEQRLPVPRPLAKLALAAMRRSVSKRAGFDITKVSPVDAVSQSFIPALFGHATGDTFIRISHAEALHAAYAGDKNLIRFEGDHNSRRPEFFYNSVSIFWHNTLQLEQLLEPALLPTALLPSASAAAAGGGTPGRAGGVGIPLAPPMPPPRRRSHHERRPGSPAGSGASSDGEGSANAAGASGAAAAGRAGGGADGADGGGDDVAEAGAARRSAPWEPRMWEWDMDRAERERQRFRRMAGGLPGPPEDPRDAAAGGGVDLASLLAAAADPASAAGAGLGSDGGGAPLGGMLLPGSEEEEEAQLLAALQLSLLEAAATGPPAGGTAAAATAVVAGRPPGLRPGEQGAGSSGAAAGPFAQQGPHQPPLQQRQGQQAPLPVRASSSCLPAGGEPTVARRSLSHEESLLPSRLPTPQLGALSGPQHAPPPPPQQQQQPRQQLTSLRGGDGRPGDGFLLPSLIPASPPNAAPPHTASPGAAPSVLSPPPSGTAPVASRAGSGAAAGSSGGAAAAAGHPVRRNAVVGPSLYDMYSEEELLALAVQLSLAEAAGTTHGSAADAGSAAGGHGGAPSPAEVPSAAGAVPRRQPSEGVGTRTAVRPDGTSPPAAAPGLAIARQASAGNANGAAAAVALKPSQ